MTLAARRGNALPETALVMSLALMLVFGGMQMAIAAYTQLSVDGASFVAARSTVQHFAAPNVATNCSTLAPFAAGVAHSIFDRVNAGTLDTSSGCASGDLAVSNPDNASFETLVTKTIPGFSFLPGSPSFTLTGRDIEAQLPIGPVPGDLLGFSHLPATPGQTGSCPSLTGSHGLLSGPGQNINSNLNSVSSQSSNLNKTLGDLNQLVTGVESLQGNALSSAVSSAVSGALAGLSPLMAGLLAPILSANNSAITGVVTNVLQQTVNSALSSGSAPTASGVIASLTSALTALLGPLIGSLLGPLLNAFLTAVATTLEQTVFAPLFPALTAVAGDHSILSSALNGSCS